MSAFDDKHYYLSDGIRSYAYGHYKIGQKHRNNPERTLKSYIEMNERESIGDLAEHLNIEIEGTYSPPDPGFWQTAQIDSDDDEIVDFDVAPKENPFPTMSLYRFRS